MTTKNKEIPTGGDRLAAGDGSNKRVKKRVSFAQNSELETIYIVESYKLEKREGDLGAISASSMSSLHLSDEISLLSTLHEKSRRYLREIDSLDEEAAVLYGTVTSGRPDPKTKLPRWKYTFGNTVLITDHTSRVKVTCYKQSVVIPPAPISQDILDRHAQVKQILEEEPQLCMSHTIVILDQSGSMRTADVHGFRNRSQAAYGSLALDYVAEQLYQQGDPAAGVDTLTLIEMNDEGTMIYEREPLDWILFNKLLERQDSARPRSHGNYMHSLLVAQQHIKEEIERLGDMDHEDLPNFALVVLSDGKPSDKEEMSATARLVIVHALSALLKDKLTVFCMGLGAAGSDFNELSNLTVVAESGGARGAFNHAGLSAANLGKGFSSISSTMSSLREDMLSTIDDKEEEADPNIVALRNRKSFAKSGQDRKQVMNDVVRYRFDQKSWEDYNDPWERIAMKNRDAKGFTMDTIPFGKGAERLAFRFQEINAELALTGKMMVAKESKTLRDEGKKLKFHELFCRSQMKASELAMSFNKAINKTPSLRPIQQHERLPPVEFLKCHVYEFVNQRGKKAGVLVEKLLEGKWMKYTSNDGSSKVTRGGRTIEIAGGTVFAVDFLQAFSHWSYVHTGDKLLVCDLQGVLNEEGRVPFFELTDPAICSRNKRGFRFGKTDLGNKGMRGFCNSHKCTLVCKNLGLAPFGTRAGASKQDNR